MRISGIQQDGTRFGNLVEQVLLAKQSSAGRAGNLRDGDVSPA